MGKGEPANGTDDLARLDAVGLAEAIRKGDLSPVESVQAAIDRIQQAHAERIDNGAQRLKQRVTYGGLVGHDSPGPRVDKMLKSRQH